MSSDAVAASPTETGSPVTSTGPRESRLKYAVAIGGPFVLAIGYLWGVVYHSIRTEAWGFRSYSPDLSTPDVYVQAFLAFSSVVRHPWAWLESLSFWIVIAVVLVTVAIGCFGAWVKPSPRMGRFRAWLLAWARRMAVHPGFRIVEGGVNALASLLVVPGLLLMLSVGLAMLITPPYLAAHADARRAWQDRAFQHWDRVTWSDDDGQKRSGFVHSCMSDDCALLDESGQAFVVARDKVGSRSNQAAAKFRVARPSAE